ncbi:hypothetical protein CGERO_10355 [Corynebacterium gerontici]|uniref:DUF559 domain-containing protein n=2 Tax=Corynebacterium gerontici TaxID=2079234 RepID=A0A3G6J8K6_9CORY|nr:hypothetical protein CGERO_10355 [Corynebacterium gerontici]
MLGSGALVRIFRGHYSRGRPTPDMLLQWLREHKPFARITGVTAQEHHEGRPLSLPLHVEVPRGRGLINNEYFRMRHCRNLRKKPSEGVFANAVETARQLDFTPEDRRHFIARAYPGKGGLQRCLNDSANTPRLGRELKRDLRFSPIGCDSNTERRFFAALANLGVELRHNKPIGPYRFDAVCEKAKLIIEIDGYDYHSGEEVFKADRWKGNAAQLHGYRVLRYSASCIDTEFDTCVEQVMRALQPRLPATALTHVETTGVWKWHSQLRYGQRWR